MYAQELIEQLKQGGNPDKARWLENYFKHDIRSYGVGIPAIRALVKTLERERRISEFPLPQQTIFLDELMRQAYTEPRLAAILYLQLFGSGWPAERLLRLTEKWFDRGWIFDWNVCDWLCVRLLSPLLDDAPETAIPVFEKWNRSPMLWKSRASLVPFAQCRTIDRHDATIFAFAERLIKREERFCKTAVGWVLREYSKIDAGRVRRFLDQHQQWTSKEVIKNATKYL